MYLALAIVSLCLAPVTLGDYDTLELGAEQAVPRRLGALRDSLLDPEMYREVMFHVLTYYLPTDSQDELCSNHSGLLQDAFLQDRLWALKMMDASTKPGDGVLHGNIQSLGSYDQCLSVTEPSRLFTGQLCVVQTRGLIPPVVPNAANTEYSLMQPLDLDLTVSVCVPSSCSVREVAAHWQGVMAEVNASATVGPLDCSVRGDVRPTSTTWAAITLWTVLILLVVASTAFDYSINHIPTKEQRILLSFSAYSNLKRLMSCERPEGSLGVLDGLRVLAISWIVLGHRFEQSLQIPNLVMLNMEKYTTAWFMAPVLNMMLAVELFFLLSGCLLAYHFLQARHRGSALNLSHFYYKRYLRLTPALAAAMVLEGCLMIHMSDGPLWKRIIGHRMSSCVNYWWSSLLYVSNYVNPYNTCVLQTWYLSVDTQLYLLSPLLLVPLSRSPRGLLLLALCYGATTAAAFSNAFYLNLPAGATVTLDKKTEQNHGYEYVKTHVRAASWLTGIALGYILHCRRQCDHPWKPTKVAAAGGWMLCLLLCVGSVYSIAPFQSLHHQYSPLVDSLHIALHRNVFSLGAAGIVFLCVCGRGGFVKDFLAWRGFRPLAVLSYGVYLCHMGWQIIGLARVRQPYAFDMYSLLAGVMSDLLLANLIAVVLYLTVEAPFWLIGSWLYSPAKEQTTSSTTLVTGKLSSDSINIENEKTIL